MLMIIFPLTEELQCLHSLLDLQLNPRCVAMEPVRSYLEVGGKSTS